MTKPKIVLADDSSRILSALSKILSNQFDVVACVLNGDQAVEATLRFRPDVVVLDIAMPGSDGIQAARQLRQKGSLAKIVFLTSLGEPEFIAAAIDLQCSGFVIKNCLFTDLPAAINAALDGQAFFSSKGDDQCGRDS